MKRSSLFLTLCLGSVPAFAGDVRLRLDPSLPDKCQSLLHAALEPLGGSGTVHATTYGRLDKTLVEAGQRTLAATVDGIRRSIPLNRLGFGEKLRHVFTTLDTAGNEELVFCLADKGCKLMSGLRGLHMHASHFETGPAQHQWDLPSVADVPVSADVDDIILLKLPKNDIETSEWALDFIEEASHYVDSRTLDRWVDTNRRRLEAGEAADALFQRMAELQNDVVYLPEGFVHLFTETSAAENKEEFFRALGHSQIQEYMPDQVQRLVRNAIRRNPETRAFVNEHGITADNLFATYREWYREISASLATARP
jgi:hypothetical protein